jgi:hypothetical protein
VERVDLLAYHEYATVKYQQLGRLYKIHNKAVSQEQIEKIKITFERYGLKVQLGG